MSSRKMVFGLYFHLSKDTKLRVIYALQYEDHVTGVSNYIHSQLSVGRGLDREKDASGEY